MKGETTFKFNGPEMARSRLTVISQLEGLPLYIHLYLPFMFLLKLAADHIIPFIKLKLLKNKAQPRFTNPSQILNGGKS